VTVRAQEFHTWDGTRLSFTDEGATGSDRVIVFTNGLTCTGSYWRFVHESLGADHRLVTWDLRGHGASDPPANAAHVRVDDLARDVLCLVDHLGLQKPVFAGFSMGVEIILEAALLSPDRCAGLLAITGTYQNPLGGLWDNPIPAAAWRWSLDAVADMTPKLASAAWHNAFKLPFAHTIAHLTGACGASEGLMRAYYAHQTKLHVPTVLRMGAAGTRHDAGPRLSDVRCPALVIAGLDDAFTPVRLSRTLRDRLPRADYVEIPTITHTGLLEAPGPILASIRTFLGQRVWPPEPA